MFEMLAVIDDPLMIVAIGVLVATFIVLAVIVPIYIRNRTALPILSEAERQNMLDYGIIHFTTDKGADGIIHDMAVRPSEKKSILKSERNLVWFYLCTEPADALISRIWTEKASDLRADSTACLHFYPIPDNEFYPRRNAKTCLIMALFTLLPTKEQTA